MGGETLLAPYSAKGRSGGGLKEVRWKLCQLTNNTKLFHEDYLFYSRECRITICSMARCNGTNLSRMKTKDKKYEGTIQRFVRVYTFIESASYDGQLVQWLSRLFRRICILFPNKQTFRYLAYLKVRKERTTAETIFLIKFSRIRSYREEK